MSANTSTTDMTASEELDIYMDVVFGTTKGFVHLAAGQGGRVSQSGKYEFNTFKPRVFAWPAERGDAVDAVRTAVSAGHDAYVCPYVHASASRKKGNAASRPVIHADVDGELDMEKVRSLKAFVVGSGTPGHGHVYVQLKKSVDATTHRRLEEGLRDYLGDADAKISDNDLLRPPGTKNMKAPAFGRGQATDVSFVVAPRPEKWKVKALATLLGVDLQKPSEPKPRAWTANAVSKNQPDGDQPPVPFDLDRYQGVARALANCSGDRSADTMRVVGACVRAGLSLGQARFAVLSRDDLRKRVDERPGDDVAVCFEKASVDSGSLRSSRAEGRTESSSAGQVGRPLPVSTVPDPAVANTTVGLSRTEVGVAERWYAHFGNVWRYRPSSGWLEWSGVVWNARSESEHRRTVLAVLRSVAELEVRIIKRTDPDEEARAKKEHYAFAKSMETGRKLASISAICQDLWDVNPGDVWDADPYGINTPSGYFDFHTGVMSPHSPDLYCTKITRGSGDISATHPALDLVLDGFARTDPDLPAALQSVCALGVLGLTADVWVHVFGEPRTGKSTLFESLYRASGGDLATSYASALSPSTFERTRSGGGDPPLPALHKARGTRFWFVDELEKVWLNSELIKRISGGVTVSTRDLYKGVVHWRPKCLLLGTGNGRARIPDDDTGIAERLFAVYISNASRPAKVDPRVRHAMVNDQSCLDAVLAFAMRRAVELLAGGKTSLGIADLQEPACVSEERKHYVAAMDPLTVWLEKHVDELATPSKRTGESPTEDDLYESYIDFCSRRKYQTHLGERSFAERLETKGFVKTKRTQRSRTTWENQTSRKVRGRFFDGLRLHVNDHVSLPPADEVATPVAFDDDDDY